MAVLLIIMSLFIFFNYRLFSLLEREDWPALAYYLEQKVYIKRRYTYRNVRLLASSYLVISDYSSVLNLEAKTHLAKDSLIPKNILVFGAARILSGGYAEAALFFRKYQKKCKDSDRYWVRWYIGFSNLLAGDFGASELEFTSLAVSCGDAVISGLSAYFIANSLEKKSQDPQKCRAALQQGRTRVVSALKNIRGWKKEIEKMGTDIHTAIIRKYIDAAGVWLFTE